MKTKQKWIHTFHALLMVMCIMISIMPVTFLADTREIPEDAIFISTPEDILELAENCKVNTWSIDKTVVLNCDIDMSKYEFNGIPTFGGVFIGKGFSIKGLNMEAEGSVVGFFRYLQKTAIVENVNFEGNILPSGSSSIVGAVAGRNAGEIRNCSFKGNVSGNEQIGGLVGINETTGLIEDCSIGGIVYGNHFVGGVAGENHGVVRNTMNYAGVNTLSVQNSVALEDITMDSLMNTENASTTTDIGGIVGTNSGVIRACQNNGTVGYKSMGYNIGGIAGRQSGYIVDCVNHADVQGRKEVGGIAGHVEPNIVLSFSEDGLEKLQNQLQVVEGSVNNLKTNIQNEGAELQQQMAEVEQELSQVQDAAETLAGILDGEDQEESIQEATKLLSSIVKHFNNLVGLLNELSTSLEDSDSETQTEINTLISQLQTSMDNISKALETLNPESLNTIMTELSTLMTKLNELLSKIQSSNSDNENAATENNTNSTDFETALNTLKQNLEDFEKLLNSGDITKALEILSSIQTNLDELTKLIEEMEKSVEGLDPDKQSELQTILTQIQTSIDNIGKAFESQDLSSLKNIVTELSTLTKTLGELLDKLEEGYLEVQDTTKEWSESLEKMQTELNGLQSDFDKLQKILDSIEVDQPDAVMNDVGNSIGDLFTVLGNMGSSVDASSKNIKNALDAVMSDLDGVMDIADNLDETIQATIEDISEFDQIGDTLGKIANSKNYGSISGDYNIGGIVGLMGEETDLSTAENAEIIGSTSLNASYQMKAVVRGCKNEGKITANKQYAGGIAGQMMLGCILESVNLGNIDALNADYVGGIVGDSDTIIRNCSTKSVIAGDTYVGGIAGEANEVTDCYAFVQIAAATEKAGAVIGHTEELPIGDGSVVSGNIFFITGDSLGGIDGISYTGATDQVDLTTFLQIPNLDESFKTVNIRFCGEGQIDVTKTIAIGESFAMDQIPTLSVEEGDEFDWILVPAVTSEVLGMGEIAEDIYISEEALTEILFDQTYEVSFDAKGSVVSVADRTENNLSPLLAVGSFAKNTKLEMKDVLESETQVNGKDAIVNYEITLSNIGVKSLHFLLPEGAEADAVKLLVKDTSGKWTEREFIVEGSYIVFTFTEGDVGFALIKNAGTAMGQIGSVAIVAAVILVVLFLGNKLRKKSKQK